MKPPITLLKDLQDNLKASPLVAMQSLLDFAKHDLEGVIQGVEELIAGYEERLRMRDEELSQFSQEITVTHTTEGVHYKLDGAYV